MILLTGCSADPGQSVDLGAQIRCWLRLLAKNSGVGFIGVLFAARCGSWIAYLVPRCGGVGITGCRNDRFGHILRHLVLGTVTERILVLIKPDGIERQLDRRDHQPHRAQNYSSPAAAQDRQRGSWPASTTPNMKANHSWIVAGSPSRRVRGMAIVEGTGAIAAVRQLAGGNPTRCRRRRPAQSGATSPPETNLVHGRLIWPNPGSAKSRSGFPAPSPGAPIPGGLGSTPAQREGDSAQ